jgi:hypothetical protein
VPTGQAVEKTKPWESFCRSITRGDPGAWAGTHAVKENQKLFRRGNESLHDAAVDSGYETEPVPFLCECADEDCLGRVEVTPSQWEVVANEPNHYLMIAGHPRSEGEEAVGSIGEYEVGRKPD